MTVFERQAEYYWDPQSLISLQGGLFNAHNPDNLPELIQRACEMGIKES